MATPHSVFGSPEQLKAVGESIAKSMAAQSIAGVSGAVDPKMAAQICNVIRAQEYMIQAGIRVIVRTLNWVRISVAINIILAIALIVAIVV